MKTLPRRLTAGTLSIAAALFLAAPAQAAGLAEVSYTEPAQFSDIGRGALERERTMAQITVHLQALAQRLPEGQVLRVEFTDIDLAGEPEPRRIDEVRVLRGRADWPRLALRWSLLDNGRTLKAGEDRIADMTYLNRLPASARKGALPYELALLDRWFEERFATAH